MNDRVLSKIRIRVHWMQYVLVQIAEQEIYEDV